MTATATNEGADVNCPDEAVVSAIVTRLRSARRVLVVTGAGMSADSGLPTYRGVGGLYEDVGTEEGIAIEQALSGAMMTLNPACCWRHIMRIEKACRGAQPHAGHRILAAWAKRFELCVLTQNVDGLHHAAGSREVIDIHGDVRDVRCTACDHEMRVADYQDFACPPLCPECGKVLRPQVVLFGERLPAHKLGALQEQLAQGFDVAFSIGTTSVFPYVSEPILHTRLRGGFTVEINPSETSLSDMVDERLRCGAAVALQSLAKQLDH